MSARLSVALALGLVALGSTLDASAQGVEPDRTLAIQAGLVFGMNGIDPVGDEMFVRIENTASVARQGTIVLRKEGWGKPVSLAYAPFAVAANGAASIHFPVQSEQVVNVEVADDSGKVRFSSTLSPAASNTLSIVDATEPSRLRATIEGISLDPDYHVNDSGTPAIPIDVLQLHIDRTSGDPIFPQFVAGWRNVDLALVDSGVLSRLQGAELEALVAYVLAGGELAVVVTRPEDLRQPTIAAFVGGEVRRARPDPSQMGPIFLAPPPVPTPPKWSVLPANPADTTEVTGYTGGNLAACPTGAAAAYGLGEVVLLGFNPTQPEVASDPWVQVRIADLARRGYERKSASVFGVSASNRGRMYLYRDYYQEVRRQLDPNQSARWAIGVATAILCLYAVIAGPLVFWFFKRRGKPLRALAALPFLSIFVFFIVVGVGFVSKGATSRSRRLTFVDAGGGMSVGVAQRYRAYFSSSSRELTVTATNRSSVIRSEIADTNNDADTGEVIGVTRDGARLERVAAVPWQTVLVREQGIATLGDGIALVETPGGNVTVKNRTGRALRAVIVKLPNDDLRFVSRLDDAASVDTSDLPVGALRSWSASVRGTMRVGRADVHELKTAFLRDEMNEFPEVVDAWRAAESTTPNSLDWLPTGLPVVLADVEGGEGKKSDAGMAIDSDRMLVRVVGWGGEP